MTIEQMNAFQTWWNKSSIGCDRGTDCREAFASGWEAHAAATANSRTAERSSAEQAARQIERAGLKRWLLHKATSAFLSGADDLAKTYRDLANSIYPEKEA